MIVSRVPLIIVLYKLLVVSVLGLVKLGYWTA